jgi:LuxR family maltose regulon positive regulatory protein
MIDAILSTKLFIPSTRPNTIKRPRLVGRLNSGLEARHLLTLISAPAGYGKTTLLAEWIATHQGNVAWLALDEQDNNALRFWTYFVAALQTLSPKSLGQTAMRMLESSQVFDPQTLLTSLVNDAAALDRAVILVLDDYHVISNQAIHEAMTFLLEHLPPSLHLVIATRADPPLPISRLRARGQLAELRVADLRFTAEEASAFLNDSMNLGLTAADVQALETRRRMDRRIAARRAFDAGTR